MQPAASGSAIPSAYTIENTTDPGNRQNSTAARRPAALPHQPLASSCTSSVATRPPIRGHDHPRERDRPDRRVPRQQHHRPRDSPDHERVEREEPERRLGLRLAVADAAVEHVVGIARVREPPVPETVPVGQLVQQRVVAERALEHRDPHQQHPRSEVDQDREPEPPERRRHHPRARQAHAPGRHQHAPAHRYGDRAVGTSGRVLARRCLLRCRFHDAAV